jgi:hypothetical protein
MRPKPTRKDIRESIQSNIRKITPPGDVERENNNPVQPREDSYAKAHDFATRFYSWRSGKLTLSNPHLYERKFTTPMSTKEWIKLSDELNISESDDQSVFLFAKFIPILLNDSIRYPRYTFNSATSTLIIQCMPSPIHESLQFCFTSAIAEAQANLPLPERCFCVTGQEMTKFEGQYLGSAKIADIAVQIRNAKDQLETKMVVEMGFSEEYEALIDDARLWLEGMSSVSLCVLVSFEEEPRYQCPVDANMDEEEFKKLGFPDPWELGPEHFHLEGTFGPAIYKRRDDEELDDEERKDEELDHEELDDEELDHEELDDEELDHEERDDEESDDKEPDNEQLKWTGKISSVFLERWKRDAGTGKAKKPGRRIVSFLLLMRISLTNWYVIGPSYCT